MELPSKQKLKGSRQNCLSRVFLAGLSRKKCGESGEQVTHAMCMNLIAICSDRGSMSAAILTLTLTVHPPMPENNWTIGEEAFMRSLHFTSVLVCRRGVKEMACARHRGCSRKWGRSIYHAIPLERSTAKTGNVSLRAFPSTARSARIILINDSNPPTTHTAYWLSTTILKASEVPSQ